MSNNGKKCEACKTGWNPTLSLCPKCDKSGFLTAVHNGADPFDFMGAKRLFWSTLLPFGLMIMVPTILSLVVFFYTEAVGDANDIALLRENAEQFIAIKYPKLQEIGMLIGQCMGAVLALFMMRPYLRGVLATFTKYKNILKSLGIIAVVIAMGYGWNNLVEYGLQVVSNDNQAAVIDGISVAPVVSFFTTAIGAPLLEELAFRCGLFGLIRRKSKVWAYIISSAVFLLIHMNFVGANLTAELLAIPSYLLPAVSLAFIYDKYGFAGSFIAHLFNNGFGYGMILLLSA